MVQRHLARLAVALTGVVALVVGGPTAAFAQPTNDDFTAAVAMEGLPFTTTLDTSDATWDPSDPAECSTNGSVWYSFTPTSNMRIQADTFGSNYDTVLSAWTGSQGSLSLVYCNDDYNGTQSQINFAATAGTTYYFLLARCCGSGESGGGSLVFSVQEIQASVNDDFADALTVGSLPYSNTQDYTAATAEPGEPSSCFNPVNTVWYSYTATGTGPITASIPYYSGIAAYTGTSIDSLTQVGCRGTYTSSSLTFVAQAGTTYHFQVEANGNGQMTFQLDVSPDPIAEYNYYPYEPSSYDMINFNGYPSVDPAGAGIATHAWDFGDGTTGTGYNPSHRFAADGDYTVSLTVRTFDGRTDSVSHVVQIRTHDVSIDRLNVPANARVGQTIGVNVYVKNTRYPENVRVTLYKSVPSGYTEIGSSTQLVKVSTTGQTTRYSFNYTVTGDDLTTGKITFRALATISLHPDALPADNELLSTPVKVSS
ncbi:PKD domain-containing protein [Micromonospora chersina]|uniref:PKD domain-containing protein n=1 Tax=Micromonospora chersina TaxID=47854 RepID=UPI003714EE51